jgi:DNA modification methylase
MTPYYQSEYGTLYNGDALAVLRELPDCSVNCCVTSPPYWGLRDYGVAGQIGLEESPGAYVARMVEVFREVRRVLRDDGTCWVNLGDSYVANKTGCVTDACSLGGGRTTQEKASERPDKKAEGLKPKDLIGIPWRVAFALQADGWYLRQDIIWSKPNPMPESVRDRCTKSHEYIFLLSKRARYYYDAEAISEPVVESTVKRMSQDTENQHGSERVPGKTNGTMKAVAPRYGGNKYTANPDVFSRTKSGNAYDYNGRRNRRDVWTVATQPFSEAHFATFPPALIEPCILAGCPKDGTVIDPFFGSGTTGIVCQKRGRKWGGIELNPEYCALAVRRVNGELGQIEGQTSLFAKEEL